MTQPSAGVPASAAISPAPDACLAAHGVSDAKRSTRSLVVIYAGELARHLVAFATACDFAATVVEPDPRLAAAAASWAGQVHHDLTRVATGADTDVVVTDHHREDLGVLLAAALRAPTRWIGVIGNPRHPGPHVELLAGLGVAATEIARVHRPIGLNIGSRAPAEIAVSILAGLLAHRSGRPGGFGFGATAPQICP